MLRKNIRRRGFPVPPAANFGYAKERPSARAGRDPMPKKPRREALWGSGASRKKRARVQIYLPIADLPVNIFLILAMGAAVGFVSGLFGIGGGFLMTPLLIFLGIAPAVAVASVASHIAASSFSGAIARSEEHTSELQSPVHLVC